MQYSEVQFVEFVVKALCSNPEAVKVERSVDEIGVLLQLHVHPQDAGRVIGKGGCTINSLRTVLKALGRKNDTHYGLKFIDSGREDGNDA